jgi:glucose-6-phosphate-specific signal transduction histidine kinase
MTDYQAAKRGGRGEMVRNFIHEHIIWIYLIIATSLMVILTAVFSLSHGVNEIFPYFFLIPVLLVAYAFPHRGVMFTITLGWIYIVLVYVFGTFSTRVIAVHTAWFFIFVSLGIVISYYAESSKISKKQVEQLKREAFQQIEHNMEQNAILNDQIRNPLQAIMLDTTMVDEKTKALVTEQVKTIEKILDKLDEGVLESENVRKFLRKYYGLGKK